MAASSHVNVRLATPDDAEAVAHLLDAFNREYDTPTPGPDVLARRLRTLLATDTTFAVVAGEPLCSVALMTLRSNVFTEGPVALLDEMYVVPDRRSEGIGSAVLTRAVDECVSRSVGSIEINVDEPDVDAMRFYRRHGFTDVDPDTGDRAFYFYRDVE